MFLLQEKSLRGCIKSTPSPSFLIVLSHYSWWLFFPTSYFHLSILPLGSSCNRLIARLDSSVNLAGGTWGFTRPIHSGTVSRPVLASPARSTSNPCTPVWLLASVFCQISRNLASLCIAQEPTSTERHLHVDLWYSLFWSSLSPEFLSLKQKFIF